MVPEFMKSRKGSSVLSARLICLQQMVLLSLKKRKLSNPWAVSGFVVA